MFESASSEKVEAERGRLVVPENRRNPKRKLIELAVVRFKSTSPKPGPPIVYLAGGPGGSGIAAARGTRFPLFQAMREIGDVRDDGLFFGHFTTASATDRTGSENHFARRLDGLPVFGRVRRLGPA